MARVNFAEPAECLDGAWCGVPRAEPGTARVIMSRLNTPNSFNE